VCARPPGRHPAAGRASRYHLWWVSTSLQQLIGSSAVSFMLSYMLMKAWLPFAPQRPGEVLLVVPLGLIQRLLLHRWQALAVLVYIVLGSIPPYQDKLYLPGTQPAALISLLVILALPVRYVFTDRGVAIGKGVPRFYKAFRRFETRPGRGWLAGTTTLTLRGRKTPRGSNPSFTLYLPSERVPEVTRLLKRYLR